MPDATHAQALACHVEAALVHLRQAEGLAELAGVDVVGESDSARLRQAIGNLDMWVVNNARPWSASCGDLCRDGEAVPR
jgi:hypothetical protein